MSTAPVPLAAAVACVVVVVSGPAGGQSTQPPPPQFRTGVELIRLDVTVLDSARRPVRDLKASDFTLLEDGAPQTIVAFSETYIPEPEPVATPWIREVAADVRTNILPDGRLMVLVLDDATIPFDPAMVKNARDIGRGIVERLGPNDLLAVVFARDNRHAQDFTSDRARLQAAIDRFTSGFAFNTTPGSSDEYFQQSSMDTLAKAAEYLSAAPQRRKALFYVSVGLPFDTEQLTEAVQFGTFGDVQGSMSRLLREMQTTFRDAQRGNVSIYAFDPSGLGGLEHYFLSRLRMDPAAAATRARPYYEFLQTVSESTGGRAVIHTNDPASEIPEIFRETGSYYLLGYQPTNSAQNGKYRRLQVRVNRPGVSVIARDGYFAPRAEKTTKSGRAPSTLASAIAGVLPKTDLPMAAGAAWFAPRSGSNAALAIVAGIRQPGSAERVVQDVELLVSAFSPEGRPRGSKAQNARVTLRPVTSGYAQFEVLSRLDLEPGRYSLRIAANNKSTGLSGSVYTDVEIPDFKKSGVSLSGLVLTATPAIVSAPKDAFASLIPVVPTIRREFARTDRVTAFMRVYQGGSGPLASVPFEARILNDRNARVFGSSGTLAASDFTADRSADYRLDLPLADLEPGPYLLTITMQLKGGAVAGRDVRFSAGASAQDRPK
jgi:VWFA-related protein